MLLAIATPADLLLPPLGAVPARLARIVRTPAGWLPIYSTPLGPARGAHDGWTLAEAHLLGLATETGTVSQGVALEIGNDNTRRCKGFPKRKTK